MDINDVIQDLVGGLREEHRQRTGHNIHAMDSSGNLLYGNCVICIYIRGAQEGIRKVRRAEHEAQRPKDEEVG